MKIRGALGLIAVALLLAGCDIFLAVPLAVTPLVQTVAIDATAGCATVRWQLDGKGTIAVDYGDGSTTTIRLELHQPLTVAHTYSIIGEYDVTFRQGAAQLIARAIVTFTQPVVLLPFWAAGWIVDAGEVLHFQVDHREVGCDGGTGHPQYETGVVPGEGITEVRLFAWDADGTPVGVFNFSRPAGDQGVWGEWVLLPVDERDTYTLSVFLNYYDLDTPKLPLAPRGCGDVDDWEDGPGGLSPGDPGYERHNKFLLEARNEFTPDGKEVQKAWRIWYTDTSCSAAVTERPSKLILPGSG